MAAALAQLLVGWAVLSLLSQRSFGLSCNKVSTCKCDLDDGSGSLDFTSVGTIKTQLNDYEYYYSCSGVPCDGEFGSCSGFGCSACQQSLDGAFNYGLGQIDPTSFQITKSSAADKQWVVKILYNSGNDGRQYDIEFTYSESAASMQFSNENPSKDYHLIATDNFGIPGSSGGGGGGGIIIVPELYVDAAGIPGIILLIVLIVAVVSYVVVGCLVNALARKKQGLEIVPNFEFWKDFPFLLKDGFLFTFTYPCKKYKERNEGYQAM